MTTLTDAIEIARTHLQAGVDLRGRVLREMAGQIADAAQDVGLTLANGHKILLCGNGGSAADAQHIAAEFVGRYKRERRALPAIALTTDTSILTAIGNDYGVQHIFARQVMALGHDGDVLIALSTSGESPNVLRAAEVARARGMAVIALTGATGGKLTGRGITVLAVPSTDTALIQEVHIAIGHIIVDVAERMASA